MSFEASLFLIILVGMIISFFRQYIPIELTALTGLIALVLVGLLTPEQAFEGFSSPVTITMLSMFALGAALAATGATDRLAALVFKVARKNEAGNVSLIMVLGVIFSSFMNNVAAAALLLPVVGSVSHRSGIAQSRLLMPLSFATLLGGMCTLIGTPPNLLAHEALRARGDVGFALFDFLPFGLAISLIGIAYMACWGHRLLPQGSGRLSAPAEDDLPRLYGIEERLFSVRVSHRIAAGKSLTELGFGHDLGLVVVMIERHGKQILAPSGQERIFAGDLLVVSGKQEHQSRLEQVGEISSVSHSREKMLSSDTVAVFEAVLSPRSRLLGKSLQELSFREHYDCLVLAVLRRAEPIHSGFSEIPLEFGDGLLLQGPRSRLAMLKNDPDFLVLSDVRAGTSRLKKAPFVVIALLSFLLLVALKLQPVHVAALISALIVLLSGALSVEDFYRGMSWRIVFFVAAILPLGLAAHHSGFPEWLSGEFLAIFRDPAPLTILAVFCLLAAVIGQLVEPSLAIILLGPVVIEMAHRLGSAPEPLLMGLALGASVGFQTPFSNRANLLVMAAGGYRFRDYLVIGTPLALLVYGTIIVTVSFWYGVSWR